MLEISDDCIMLDCDTASHLYPVILLH